MCSYPEKQSIILYDLHEIKVPSHTHMKWSHDLLSWYIGKVETLDAKYKGSSL